MTSSEPAPAGESTPLDTPSAQPIPTLIRIGLLLVLLSPLTACHALGTESLRRVILSAGMLVLLIGAGREMMRSGTVEAPAGWALAVLGSLFLWTVYQAGRYANLHETAIQVTLLISGPALFLILITSAPARAHFLAWSPGVILFSAFFISAIGFCQLACLRGGATMPACFGMVTGARGMASIFGESNSAGTYVCLLMPMVAAGALFYRRATWYAALTVLSAYLLISNSRAGLIASVAAGAVLLATVLVKNRALTRPAGGLLAAVLVGLIAGYLSLGGKGQEKWTRELPERGNLNFRMDAWTATLKMWTEDPIRGVGPGNYHREFHRFRTPEVLSYNALDPARPEFFRTLRGPHQSYLHLLSELGIPGLLLPVALMAGALCCFWRWFRTRPMAGEDLWVAGFAALLVAFAAASVFNTLTMTVEHWIMAWAAAGMVWGIAGTTRPAEGPKRALILAGVGISAGILLVCLRMHGGMILGQITLRNRDAETAVTGDASPFLKALSFNPWSVQGRLLAALAYEKQGKFEKALEYQDAVRRWEPHHPEHALRAGRMEFEMGAYDKAIASYETSKRLAPPWAAPRVGLAKVYMAQSAWDRAETELSKAVDLNPTWDEARELHAIARSKLGRKVGP